ncbi:unnamed protein product [Heligmosomoides polygyrus]|uniref:Uncharacterized protein n=1 Tax=Heligmosomoides polygyrus TaxID=6339 RepID=A0A183F2R9_HELPZ|nr:unnamed protein product [Heligmosomoides polygyrus]
MSPTSFTGFWLTRSVTDVAKGLSGFRRRVTNVVPRVPNTSGLRTHITGVGRQPSGFRRGVTDVAKGLSGFRRRVTSEVGPVLGSGEGWWFSKEGPVKG